MLETINGRETAQEREAREIDEKLQQIRELQGGDFNEITAYPYRKTEDDKNFACPPVKKVLFPHDLGMIYGPGEYIVAYHGYMSDGSKFKGARIRYNIGPEYEAIHRAYCRQYNKPCYLDYTAPGGRLQNAGAGIMELFTEEKLKAIAAFMGTLKIIMQGGNDSAAAMAAQNTELMKAMIASRPAAPSLPESLVTKSFELLAAPKQAPGLSEQLNLFGELAETIDRIRPPQVAALPAAKDEEEEGGIMAQFGPLISQVMAALPGLLSRNNNSIPAAAAEARANPLVSMTMKSKEVQNAFYTAAVKEYGPAAAEEWARGMGLNPAAIAARCGGVSVVSVPRSVPSVPGVIAL